MNLIRARKFTYAISIILVLASIVALSVYKLKLGIDFTGGAILEAEYDLSTGGFPEIQKVQEKMSSLGLGDVRVQRAGERGVIVRTRDLSEEEHQKVSTALMQFGKAKELRFDSIGPTIGRELRNRSLWAILGVLVMIVLYIAWAFRKVSKPVSSWFYGLFAVVALFHDILIPLGVFSILGKFKGVEIDTLFVTAILTVLGFSIHDTIVVFDRVRENLRIQNKTETFEETVGRSLSQTLTRSINTSLTVFIVLVALFFVGSESTKYFSLALIIGVISGTYSSIFIASSLLVTWNNFRSRA
ncbi:protein translocase subunit SecF [Candidatus Giovannonibacteria bacterium]|nr:protein translocase subunit SecF [Candidatus Giovannonibacteria bacterium]